MFELFVSRRCCHSLNRSGGNLWVAYCGLSNPPGLYNRVAERLAEGANGSQLSFRASSPGTEESTVLPLSDVRTLLLDNFACAGSWTHRPTVWGDLNPRHMFVLTHAVALSSMIAHRRKISQLCKFTADNRRSEYR